MTEPSDGSADAWTAAGCVEFLEKAAAKGWINPSSAKGLRTTFGKVMSIEEDWERTDLRTLDIEDYFDRFRRLRRNDYSDGSMRVYHARFQQAVKMYLARENNEDWKAHAPASRMGNGKSKPKASSPKLTPSAATAPEKEYNTQPLDFEPVNLDVPDQSPPTEQTSAPARQAPAGTPTVRQIDHTFPLRDDLDVTVQLPRDLTVDEAEALAIFINSLVRKPIARDAST